jgi:hypothetical protein
MKYYLIIFVLFSPHSPLTSQEDGPWSYFQSLEGDFSIDFPEGQMVERADTVETAIGAAGLSYFYGSKRSEGR